MSFQPTSPERWNSSSRHTMGRACNEEVDAERIRAEGDRTQAFTAQLKEQRFQGSQAALARKLKDLEMVHADLITHAEQVDNDHANLLAEHQTVQAALDAEHRPLQVIREAVELRKQRPSRELVRDEVEYELQMLEKEHLETCALYQQTLFACNNELNRLDDVRGKLQYDVEQKAETIRLDAEVLGMEAPPAVTKSHSKSSLLPYAWSGTSAELMSFAEDVCATAQRLTVKSGNIRAARDGIEEEGRRRTLVALHKRIHETTTLKTDLDTQHAEVVSNIEANQREYAALEQAVVDKTAPLDLARGRLTARLARPGAERVRDLAERALEEEVNQLTQAIDDLHLNMDRVNANLNRLSATEQQLVADIADKEAALTIDSKCSQLMEECAH
eukprot:TRINITY_DN11524_c0_g1_i1.p1 TRINITY_DN11524_c0_g1~~TRINITY_DN11524_c0_g1_i1.p1  ORF type:complete len:388 (-),score=112.87 TRINITY_DN11524_c0_g1_i1:497-1660(-)